MKIKPGLVSEPLADILSSKKWEPTDNIFFCDDTLGQRVVGYSHVPLNQFDINPRSNKLLKENMVVKEIGWSKNHYEKMIQTVSSFVSDYYKKSMNNEEEIIAFVVCNAFHEKHIKKELSRMGYNPDKMPPVINVLGQKIVSRGSVIRMEPIDYWYKQQVGDNAMMLYQSMKNNPKCKYRQVCIA